MITVSVPGKIHLMGEHAVVYGRPALLAAINLRLQVTVEEGGSGVEIEASEPGDYVRYALEKVVEHFRFQESPPLKVKVNSQLPAGFHLGSSAAVAVATVGAVTYFLKKIWNPAAINQLAYEVEKKMHGLPSGGDNSAVTFGGFLWYRRELEFFKSMWQLPLKLPPVLNHFFLINTGRPRETTGEMVAYINSKFKVQSSKFEKLFNENERQTRRLAVALKKGNEKELMEAIKVGERTLEGMGVVSLKVTPLIRQIEKAGGAAKILGGGGRSAGVGFLLGYHRELKKIYAVCQPYGYPLQPIYLGEEGIRLESKKIRPIRPISTNQ